MARPKFNPAGDVLSGVIMAATSIPQLIAYAETAGYAGYRGLATAGPPLVLFGLFTGSPYMTGGVSAVTALMAKADLDGDSYVAEHGEEAYIYLMALYSLCVATASILLAVIGFGKLAKSVPKTVQQGFKWGCFVGVFVAAVPNGFFAKGAKELQSHVAKTTYNDALVELKSVFPSISNAVGLLFTLSHPHLWAIESTMLFLSACVFLLQGKKYLPKFLPPGSEVVIVTALALVYSSYFGYSGGIVGEIPAIDPDAGVSIAGIRIPVEILDVSKIMEAPILERFGGSVAKLALSSILFAGIGFLSIMSICSVFESEDGIGWSAERELLAQASSCAVAGLVGSAPVSGALSRSLVQRMTGSTSQLACIVTALCWIYLQPYMSIMSPTPKAALSSIIVCSVIKGVLFPTDLLKAKGLDAIVCWGTGLATALTSPTQGFGFGLILYASLYPLRNGPSKQKTA